MVGWNKLCNPERHQEFSRERVGALKRNLLDEGVSNLKEHLEDGGENL